MPWRPLLQGARAARARAAIARLAGRGSRRRKPVAGPGLALGTAGVAVMHAYLARAHRDAAALRRARRHLRTALLALASDELTGALSTGLPGIAWAMAHLDREGLVKGDEVLAADLDRALLGAVRGKVWRGDLDLFQGVVGIGLAALERLPRPDARSALEHVVRHLDEAAVRVRPGLAWPSAHYETGALQYVLGVAHGSAGMIGFLAHLVELGVAPRRSRRLLDGAVSLLLAQELPRGATCRFPAALVPGEAPEPCRSAWCHGDVGIATQLWLAGRRAREPAWARVALRVARDAAARSFEDAWNFEPVLCHGSLGTAHLLNRLFQATGDPALRRGAVRHLEHGLRLWRDAESGARPYRDHGQRGLSVGDAGLALVLLAATTAVEPSWDRFMSVALPPRNT
ncbi:MAG TPA: lanthionine synthetase LanC family protein [Myxococcaceae bacterium]|nr:lanthionine synthetase LanC family protein [Myxococcaceae bacterium]